MSASDGCDRCMVIARASSKHVRAATWLDDATTSGKGLNAWVEPAKHLPAATTSLTVVVEEPSTDGHFPQCALNLRLQDRVPCTFTEYRCVFICESFAHRFGLSGCLLARGGRRSCVMSSAMLHCPIFLYPFRLSRRILSWWESGSDSMWSIYQVSHECMYTHHNTHTHTHTHTHTYVSFHTWMWHDKCCTMSCILTSSECYNCIRPNFWGA